MKKALIILLTVLCTFFSINYVYAEETNNNENVPVEITEVTPTFSVENISYNQNEINIDVVDGADVYYIYYSTNKTKGFKRIESINPTYIHRSLTSGKTYYYKVRAVKFVDGKNTYSAISNVVGKKVIPSTTNIKVSSTSYKGIKITWDKVSGASGYTIYRSTDGKSYKAIKTLTNKYTSYTNNSLNIGTKYYYKIKAYRVVSGKKVYSYYSNVVSSTPYLKVPTVTGTDTYYRYARINITKVSGATGYVVYRSTEEGTYNKIGTTSNLYYLDKTATEGETYYYKVRAYRKVNRKNKYSEYSETVEAMKLNDDISYTVSNNSYNSNKITIQKDELATKYYIYRATSSKGTYTLIKTLYGKDYEGDITYTDTKLTLNKTYYYKVKIYYKNASDYSNVLYAKTKLNTPSINVTKDKTKAVITYDKVPGASGYRIYRSENGGAYSLLKTTSSLSYTDVVLKNGTYSYKVRAYRTVSGKKIYGSYSASKEVTIEGSTEVDPDPVNPDPDKPKPDPDPIEETVYIRKYDYAFYHIDSSNSPKNKDELLNLVYNVFNNGVGTYTFYCPTSYTTCIDDYLALDSSILTSISNYVNPFHSFGSLKSSYIRENGLVIMTIEKKYSSDMIKSVNEKMDEILKSIDVSSLNDREKIKVIHDYLVEHIVYDATVDNTYDAYGALINGISSCNGYTDAMALFLDRFGIPNFKVASETHVWNLIYIDGEWKHLDVTWDDPGHYISNDYFLITTEELLNLDTDSHTFNFDYYLELNRG